MTIGIDVGGTKILGVLFDDDTVIDEVRRPTPQGVDRLVAAVAEVIEHLSRSGRAGGAAGLGLPGLVDRHGVLHRAPNLRDASPADLGAAVAAAVGRPVVVDNDATCAALAEWVLGAGRDAHDLLVVTLGTGIGGGIVAGGHLVRGARGFAGEFGHMVVDPDGPLCVCGQRGCWERYASGEGLAALGGRPASETFAAARRGDPTARAVVDQFAGWIGLGLSNLVNVLDPQRIVIGGGIVAEADLFLPRVRTALASALYGDLVGRAPEVRAATLGERAGAIGAAVLARDARWQGL